MSTIEKGVLLAKTSPAFLHANSTSHTWVFSAIAELIDNAYDPDVHASSLHIDVECVKHNGEDVTCLVFTDNGSGLTPEKLHNMLSFGYCEKTELNGYKPVGQYGNGFKSGSMRIGRDAIVFTKCHDVMSVGLLSQTYLEAIKAETILVPIISWDRKTKNIVTKVDTAGSLRSIRGHSIFSSTAALLAQLDMISHDTGTRIIIYNLKTGADGKLELDFESNGTDIINSEHHEMDAVYRPVIEYTPEYRRSLREYCSILYLKPRMKIILRKVKVKTKLIARSLKKMEVDTYKPRFLTTPVRITFGFGPTEDCGVMLYHRNRLIKAYEKVGCQKQIQLNSLNPNNQTGVGIVGVVEADFLDPIHNKQEFDKTDRYNSFIHALGQKLNDYRDFIVKGDQPSSSTMSPQRDSDAWTWAQCDNCAKWRRLPPGFDEELPDAWFCYMNRDAAHNRCDIEEEPEDEDAIMHQSATYTKIVSKQKNMEKVLRAQNIRNKEKDLERKEQELEQQKKTIDERARLDLERARMQLEEAERREADQLRMIQMLERENRQWRDKQRQLGNDIMANGSHMANINEIARHGVRPVASQDDVNDMSLSEPVEAETGNSVKTSKKRKSSQTVQECAAKRLLSDCSTTVPADDEQANGAVESDEEDNKEAVRGRLLVRLPQRVNKDGSGASVIVIDDSDASATEDEASECPEDVKPNIQMTTSPDSQSTKPKPTDVVNGNDHVNNSVPSTPASCTVARNSVRSPPSKKKNTLSFASSPALSRRRSDNNRTQGVDNRRKSCPSAETSAPRSRSIGLQTETEVAAQQLEALRGNVLQLLKTIVPTLECGHLEFVDDIVIEMVRVNAHSDDDDAVKSE